MSAVLEREQLVDPTAGMELTTGLEVALDAPRHIFLAANLLDPARQRDIGLKDGGEELHNPCLRRTSGKLPKCHITPLEFWGVQMPKELFPEGVQPLVLKGVEQPQESVNNPYILQTKPLFFMPAYPGELIVDALGIASGERRGIVEIDVLRTVKPGPETERMQNLFFPADWPLPVELHLIEERIKSVGRAHADPDVKSIAEDMERSCVEFREYAVKVISLCHSQLDKRQTHQWTYSYSPKVLALMAQLEMQPRGMGAAQLSDAVVQAVAGSGITQEQLEAIMAKQGELFAAAAASAITEALKAMRPADAQPAGE